MVDTKIQLNQLFKMPSTVFTITLSGAFFRGVAACVKRNFSIDVLAYLLEARQRQIEKLGKGLLRWKQGELSMIQFVEQDRGKSRSRFKSCPRPPIFSFPVLVRVNFLSALAMVLMPKKVRVKRVNDNERANTDSRAYRLWHGIVGIQKAGNKG